MISSVFEPIDKSEERTPYWATALQETTVATWCPRVSTSHLAEACVGRLAGVSRCQSIGLWHGTSSVRRQIKVSRRLRSHLDFTRPLLIGLPIGSLQRDLVVRGRRLHAAVHVDSAGDDLVFPRRYVAQVEREQYPTELGPRRGIQPGLSPWSIVQLNLDLLDLGPVAPDEP